ncbi:hypothetical protein G7046_g1027 [Stylonectria norvegica]|nr:hypothetical protein G7046_g1027 [Stylonectria norvegica]
MKLSRLAETGSQFMRPDALNPNVSAPGQNEGRPDGTRGDARIPGPCLEPALDPAWHPSNGDFIEWESSERGRCILVSLSTGWHSTGWPGILRTLAWQTRMEDTQGRHSGTLRTYNVDGLLKLGNVPGTVILCASNPHLPRHQRSYPLSSLAQIAFRRPGDGQIASGPSRGASREGGGKRKLKHSGLTPMDPMDCVCTSPVLPLAPWTQSANWRAHCDALSWVRYPGFSSSCLAWFSRAHFIGHHASHKKQLKPWSNNISGGGGAFSSFPRPLDLVNFAAPWGALLLLSCAVVYRSLILLSATARHQ